MPNQGNRWEPSPETFEMLLSLLHANRDQAGEEYELLRWRLMTYFEHRDCAAADELADEVLNRLMRRLEEGEDIEEPIRYSYGIAKWVAVEYQKKSQRDGGSIEDLPPIPVEPTVLTDLQISQPHLNACLQELPEADRYLIVQYLCQEEMKNKEARKVLADSLQLTQLALRLRVHRLKVRLKTCLQSRLKR